MSDVNDLPNDEAERPDSRPAPPASLLEPLRLAWDSESHADWPVAELLALMSEKAYLTPVEAATSYQKLGFERSMPVVAGSMIGYFVSAEDVAVIVFRGTDDTSDWLTNLNWFPADTPHGAIHSGFYNAYQPLKPRIATLLSESPPKHLWITGHSLGGALALVCAYDLMGNENLDLNGIITFGQPMVARKQLAEHLDSVLLGRYARYVNGKDMVPKLPPWHADCGSLVWFTEDGIKRSKRKGLGVGAAGAEDPSLKDDVEVIPLSEQEFRQLQAKLREDNAEPDRLPDGTPVVKGDLPWIQDHSMKHYLDKIRGVTRERNRNRR